MESITQVGRSVVLRLMQIVAVIAAFCIASLGSASAQTYPVKPIRIIVGYPAGGSTDAMARLVGQKLALALGQPVVIENRPGAGGQIGSALAARAEPDGYTLLFTSMGPNAIAPAINKVPYDPVASFSPISPIASVPMSVAVSSSSPFRDLASLVAEAKAHPGKVTFGSVGIGSVSHVAGEYLKSLAKVDMLHIPYKGGAEISTALLQNEITFSLLSTPDAVALMRAGRLRFLALTTAKRLAVVPEIPTVSEAGVPNFIVDVWYGLVAQAQTPKPIIDLLNRQIAHILAMPDIKGELEKLLTVPAYSSPDAFSTMIRADVEKWGKVVKDSKIVGQ